MLINNTLDGYLKDIEIKGNTWQDANNLSDIRSVGTKVEGQELYEIPILNGNCNLIKIDGKSLVKINSFNIPKNSYVYTLDENLKQ